MPEIFDAHMHLWDLDRLYYAWLQDDPLPHNPAGDISGIAGKSYGVADYLSDAAPLAVAGCVHVECGQPAQLAETDWLESLHTASGFPSVIVAGATLDDPDVEFVLRAQAARPLVRGIRQIVNWHADKAKTYGPKDFLRDEDWKRGFALLDRLGLSFDLQIYPGQMADAARLAADHPGTLIILNHTGMPTDRDQAGLQAWRAGMAQLAQRPNVAVKISGLAMVDHAWTIDSFRPFVSHAIDLFGVQRCMFASNFPVERVYGDFADLYAAYGEITADLTEEERARLFAGNARKFYRCD